MPTFPQKVSSQNLFQALQKFYKQADRQIVETFKQFKRQRNANFEGAEEEDLSEIQYNQKEFRRAIREFKQGKDQVVISWYSAQILNSAPPRLKTDIRDFKLKYRYGHWFKDENSLA